MSKVNEINEIIIINQINKVVEINKINGIKSSQQKVTTCAALGIIFQWYSN